MTPRHIPPAGEVPPDPRKPAEASVDDTVGWVGRTMGVVIILFLLLGSVVLFLLRRL